MQHLRAQLQVTAEQGKMLFSILHPLGKKQTNKNRKHLSYNKLEEPQLLPLLNIPNSCPLAASTTSRDENLPRASDGRSCLSHVSFMGCHRS